MKFWCFLGAHQWGEWTLVEKFAHKFTDLFGNTKAGGYSWHYKASCVHCGAFGSKSVHS